MITVTQLNEEDIYDVMNIAAISIEDGDTNFPGKTYEEGVQNALRWVMGDTEITPLDD